MEESLKNLENLYKEGFLGEEEYMERKRQLMKKSKLSQNRTNKVSPTNQNPNNNQKNTYASQNRNTTSPSGNPTQFRSTNSQVKPSSSTSAKNNVSGVQIVSNPSVQKKAASSPQKVPSPTQVVGPRVSRKVSVGFFWKFRN